MGAKILFANFIFRYKPVYSREHAIVVSYIPLTSLPGQTWLSTMFMFSVMTTPYWFGNLGGLYSSLPLSTIDNGAQKATTRPSNMTVPDSFIV